jgi:hypothetical protein
MQYAQRKHPTRAAHRRGAREREAVSAEEKRHVRWRLVGDPGSYWTCWELNGERVIMDDPKRLRKGKKPVNQDDRILSILASRERHLGRYRRDARGE